MNTKKQLEALGEKLANDSALAVLRDLTLSLAPRGKSRGVEYIYATPYDTWGPAFEVLGWAVRQRVSEIRSDRVEMIRQIDDVMGETVNL